MREVKEAFFTPTPKARLFLESGSMTLPFFP